ncbi:serine--tRNA ligase [Candidatus Berkelbacteria bacterium CG10_big_fil_rev_8_21_14_0_10_41_12]|uniref:Serine--tRNA ligase n=1 Tax=Candidatus Berkelbacteria bacterium CG10_big_fil_rev_8_21_14_0_10_41_12 TaxID=1974513 RepID=A0A2M6WWZ1_9BACT|nr:MAG: serine--tRNA ligase [Candidatus Berkelbacteria bacterium CG10_big_fil_rev_8_21_14_0_10_41_12]
MINLDLIRENPEKIKDAIAKKGISLDFDKLLKLDSDRRVLIQEIDEMRAQQKQFNTKIAALSDKDKEQSLSDMKIVAQDLKQKEKELGEVETLWQELILLLPNFPSDDTPVGKSDKDNVEVEKWGEPRKFDFKPKDHLALGEDLDLFDLERGAKTSGFRGYYLKNEAAILHFAILFWAFKKIVEKGFAPMLSPTILKEFALIGSGHFPFGKDDIYELANTGKDEAGKHIGEPLYLSGTSEPSLLAYFSDEILEEKDLPKKVCGFSQCYRNEVGSYGKDMRGLYRIHEFMKVEQVILCAADEKESEKYLRQMKEYSQELLRELGLPHRVVQVCTGDMGAGKRKMYDIETYMPSRGYCETHSDSDLTDWQSRRLNIKYKTQAGKKVYAYALNNTVLASPRILIALLENYQNSDGSVTIPKVLVPYTGFDRIEGK